MNRPAPANWDPVLLGTGQRLSLHDGRTVEVTRWHGEGSFARLFRGEILDRAPEPCAIKLPKPEVEGSLAYLEREREVLASARAPRLVRLTGSGTLPPPFLVLEWIEGEPLSAVVAEARRLPLVHGLAILAQVCDGLAALHRAGWAHGDLRAPNILIGRAGSDARLTDLGAAVARGEPEFEAALSEDTAGLAGLLYLMLTGTAPAPGPGRLTVEEGYHPEVVEIFGALRGGELPVAHAGRRAAALLSVLGVPGTPGRDGSARGRPRPPGD